MGTPISHSTRQPNTGSSHNAEPAATRYPTAVATTDRATTTELRVRPPIDSVSSVISSGAIPPTATPINPHITRFPAKFGIDPHMLVTVKPSVVMR